MWQNFCLKGVYKYGSSNFLTNKGYIQPFRTFKKINRSRVSTPGPPAEAKKGSLVPTPFEGIRAETGPIHSSSIKKATAFTIAFSVGSFCGASIWEYENIRSRLVNRAKTFNSIFRNGQRKVQNFKNDFEYWWNSLPKGDRVFAPILVLNLIVFGLWRIPRYQPMMVKYFCSNPAARAVCWPMILSTFSHYSLFHIFANMYVLHSFSNIAVASLGKEQFLGLYLSAGVISSLASYIFKAACNQPGLSLGASGAIMAILSFVCFEYPDTRLSILFIPMYTFSAAAAIKTIICFDLAGVLLRWKFFDHAAHLGGALFGMFWSFYGRNVVWPKREPLV
ncbi:presenilins-associated rhomboid-like protein, mitochondrial isoform X2 [Condylostylus longicornis]|nr:presenilins-associated rhomboid-like protein, mitochondrial isoform X2 [Condylostylus longicornis]